MKRFFLLYFTISNMGYSFAQDLSHMPSDRYMNKSIIDSTAINNWPSLETDLFITNDGKYFMYNIGNHSGRSRSFIIQSTTNSWQMEFPQADEPFFSEDSKLAIFKVKDTLCFLLLGTNNLKKVHSVVSYKKTKTGKGEWFAYLLNNENKELILHNLLTDKERRFNSISEYIFADNGTVLVLKSVTKEENETETNLQWVNLSNNTPTNIWSSHDKGLRSNIRNYSLDVDAEQLAFIVQEDILTPPGNLEGSSPVGNIPVCTIWYYKAGMAKAVMKVNNMSSGIDSGLFLNNSIPKFSKDGRYIFFQLQQSELRKPKQGAVKVDIWSYQDTLLQCTQLQNLSPKTYTASISSNSNRIIRLTHDYEAITAYPEKGDYVVINYSTVGDRFWLNQKTTNWLVSLVDGSKKILPGSGYNEYSFSPAGKYLVNYNSNQKHNYYSYNLTTRKLINISSAIPNGWLAYKNEFSDEIPNAPRSPIGMTGWLEDDAALLVYDNYDIWQLDPSGKKKAINITNGYGRSNNIKFTATYGMIGTTNPVLFKESESIMFTAFNTKNKYNGFYTKSLNKMGYPELLTMGPCMYNLEARHLPINDQSFNRGKKPLKARDANIWILKRQTAVEAPNYLLTKDFKNFIALTDWQPQKAYNWLTAELLSFKQGDGTVTQGILYKPENFDPTKKYPVIFNYYQQRSHRLYQFPSPYFTENNINVSWFVNKGYLVFTPDIYYKNNSVGQSALNTMVSAAKFLSQFSFIDVKKMAINGHSFGGGETNYLITHTDLFAAAIECAGVSNSISAGLQLGGYPGDNSRLGLTEAGKGGASIWGRPDLYVQNSPIMKADKVKTPLLIMHNKADGGVPWAQAVELFIALRRLEKPVWMLQYDDGGHSVTGKDAIDFTIRATQFFDYYLKGAPPPRWMTQGIPARLKGIEAGYELDKRLK